MHVKSHKNYTTIVIKSIAIAFGLGFFALIMERCCLLHLLLIIISFPEIGPTELHPLGVFTDYLGTEKYSARFFNYLIWWVRV